jgi:hypothetical protein
VRGGSLERQKHWVLRDGYGCARASTRNESWLLLLRGVRLEMRWGGWISEQFVIIAERVCPILHLASYDSDTDILS